MRINLPNSITIFRILLIPVFMAFLLGAVPFVADPERAANIGGLLAAGTFVVAAATDFVDGYAARRRHEVTVLGTFLDPLADKLLVSAALVALVQLQKLSAWVAMVIIAREFAVSGLRMVAAAEGVIIPASVWGKVKTVCQMIAIMVVILEPGWTVAGRRVSWLLLMIAVIVTVASGIDYFVRARDRLHMPGSENGAPVPAPEEREVGDHRGPRD
jgi:CDP-diacylglycerol--glycerol-3-phosphate 3-phosphatidyltransferase